MNLELFEAKILAAARKAPVSDRVPYAFEKRIMARLRQSPALDPLAFWSHALWRAVAPCLGLCVLSALLTVDWNSSPEGDRRLARSFENAVVYSGVVFAETW